jgi:hypothetical protein
VSGAFELRTMGCLLAQGRTLERASRLLLALSGAGLLLTVFATRPFPPAGALLLAVGFGAGLLQTYFAVRVAFDAGLVTALAGQGVDAGVPADQADPAARLDASLQALGLLAPDAAGRDWTARWRGMQRLMRRQAACLGVQAATFLAAIAFALLRTA